MLCLETNQIQTIQTILGDIPDLEKTSIWPVKADMTLEATNRLSSRTK